MLNDKVMNTVVELLPRLINLSTVVLMVLFVAPFSSAAQAPANTPVSRMNVVFIAVDDLNTRLGTYGHPLVKTPNLDRLAKRGIRFDRAYAQATVCNPSRTSFLSGLRPNTTGVYSNQVNPRFVMKDVVFMPEHFRKNGYLTARIGKIFHDELYITKATVDDPRSWNMSLNPKGTPRHLEGEGRNLTNGKYPWFRWLAAKGTDDDQPDGEAALEAVRFLERHTQQARKPEPFFLALGLRKPHDPYIAPARYFDFYPLARLDFPQEPADDATDMPPLALPYAKHGLGEQEGREFIRAYYACVSFMDAQVGRVLNALERLQLMDNTVIVFFSDHGLHLGEHGWWNKVTLFEPSARVPLIIAAPSVRGAGKASGRTVELIDLYPTLAELTRVPMPAGLEGKSLVPLLNNPTAEWNRPASTVIRRGEKMGRSVRSERYRYTEWDEGRQGSELYDHENDPHEFRNLVADPKHTQTVAEMKRLLPRGK